MFGPDVDGPDEPDVDGPDEIGHGGEGVLVEPTFGSIHGVKPTDRPGAEGSSADLNPAVPSNSDTESSHLRIAGPDDFVPTSHLRSLIDDVDAELAALMDLGPFSEEVGKEVQAESLPDRITDTLTIEGYRVNPRITRVQGSALLL